MPQCIVKPVSGSTPSYIVTCGDVATIPLTGNAKMVNVPAAGVTGVPSSMISSPLSAVVNTKATEKEAATKRLENANRELKAASNSVKTARSIAKINESKKDEAAEAGKRVGRAQKEQKAAQEAAQALGIYKSDIKKGGRRTHRTHRTHRKRTHRKRTHRRRKTHNV